MSDEQDFPRNPQDLSALMEALGMDPIDLSSFDPAKPPVPMPAGFPGVPSDFPDDAAMPPFGAPAGMPSDLSGMGGMGAPFGFPGAFGMPGMSSPAQGTFVVPYLFQAGDDDSAHPFEMTTMAHAWGDPAGAPVILLHGFMQSGGVWEGLASELVERGCYVVAPDLIGHGKTQGPHAADAYSLHAHAVQIRALIDAVMERHVAVAAADGADPERAQRELPVLVGYSMGGRMAEVFAAEHPELIRGLVLVSAGLGMVEPSQGQAFAERAQRQASQLMEEPLPAFIDAWEELPLFATQKTLPEQVREAIRAERLNNDSEALALSLLFAGQQHMGNLRPMLARLEPPVLYVAGGLDVTYTENARQLAELGIRTQVVPGAGHDVRAEQPAALAACLKGFLEQEGIIA